MKKLIYFAIASFFVVACSNNTSTDTSDTAADTATTGAASTETATTQEEYDETVGLGKYNAENFEVPATIDNELAKKGDAIYSARCQSCHKTTNEQLVGPGFAGVTERRTPVWIMNFLTNTDEMIDVDPALQEQLEVCMVRMPDQALAEADSRAIIEFFRKNDEG
jgi:mono/diheme cytochrome c family protein